MKAFAFSLFVLLPIATAALAQEPDAAPFINKLIRELNNKVDQDLAAGTLTQSDADELKREVGKVQSQEDSEPSLTPRTRRDLREELSKIVQDLKRKEEQAKAMASASPSATP